MKPTTWLVPFVLAALAAGCAPKERAPIAPAAQQNHAQEAIDSLDADTAKRGEKR